MAAIGNDRSGIYRLAASAPVQVAVGCAALRGGQRSIERRRVTVDEPPGWAERCNTMYFPISATFVGNVGQDAELRKVETPKGEVSVADFNIAINSGSGDDRQTQWVRVELWRNYADTVAPFVKKGMKVTVEARQAKLDAFLDKEGNVRAALVVVADRLHLPNRGRDENGAPEERDEDDIPF